jgi:hypothetical protein
MRRRGYTRNTGKERYPLKPASRTGWLFGNQPESLTHRDFGQTNVLHDRPDDNETARFRCEGVKLIGPLSDITEEALNRVGGADISMHELRKSTKGTSPDNV